MMKKLCFLLCVAQLTFCSATLYSACVTTSNFDSRLVVVPGTEAKEKAAACGYYDDTLNENGWKTLLVQAGYGSVKGGYDDATIMRAAGMIEGYLTQKDMYETFLNFHKTLFGGKSKEFAMKVNKFYEDQRDWMKEMNTVKKGSSDLWYYMDLISYQFEGLKEGYGQAAPKTQVLDDTAFDFIGGWGDFLDIQNFVDFDSRPDPSKLSKDELVSLLHSGHCSALIKVLPGYENIFASHSSWFSYAAMNRIYKHYAFKTSLMRGEVGDHSPPATEVMSFSSYPGTLSSVDDFYIMSSGLVMLQTTNGIYNTTLYEQATPKGLLAWHRVRLANWLASTGKEWGEILSQYNTGTYNNQYMVLDLKKIELNKTINDGALWVVEQIPGYVESGDQTDILRTGYWASYNVPFYEDIFAVSGYPEVMKKTGNQASYQLCPRAKIFRRDQAKVKDMESMQHLMRYNDYKNDPYSLGDPMNSICSRGDLLHPPFAGGCYDTKVTDYNLALEQMAYAENGPTHQELPPFQWSTSGVNNVSHVGQPNLFNFTFVMMKPSLPTPSVN